MKVLHVYKTYFPDTHGGVEQVISMLSKGLSKEGIISEVFCLTSRQTESSIIDGMWVHRCKFDLNYASTPLALSAFKRFKKLAQGFDIIHYHFPYPFSDLLHFFARIKKPTIVTYHSDIVKQKVICFLYKPLMNSFLKSVDKIVSTSPGYIKTSPTLRKFSNKVSLIPIGISEDDYPAPTQEGMQKFKNLFGNRFFSFVGVLRYYKGLHVLIEAVRNTNIHVVIAGSGPIEMDLKRQAKGLNNVHFLGVVSDQEKVDLVNACYGFVFPSHLRSEAFGISLLEAAMYKKPLISCEIGTGTSYINEDKETGFVVSANDPMALKNAMESLLNNPALANRMGMESYQRYNKFFVREKMIHLYKNLYAACYNKEG